MIKDFLENAAVLLWSVFWFMWGSYLGPPLMIGVLIAVVAVADHHNFALGSQVCYALLEYLSPLIDSLFNWLA